MDKFITPWYEKFVKDNIYNDEVKEQLMHALQEEKKIIDTKKSDRRAPSKESDENPKIVTEDSMERKTRNRANSIQTMSLGLQPKSVPH